MAFIPRTIRTVGTAACAAAQARRLFATSADTITVDHVVVGAGVVGLSIAERLSRHGTTLLLERWNSFGTETSSRNSEVIHNGIYYPDDSLKTKLCIRGRQLLYELCEQQGIPHRRVGKWIVAVSPEQATDLEKLHRKATGLGVPTLFLDQASARAAEPNVKADLVLVSPETGIIDSHSLMQYLEGRFIDQEGIAGYGTVVRSIERDSVGGNFRVGAQASDGSMSFISAGVVVNSAGLGAEKIAAMVLPPSRMSHLKLNWCKGHYFAYMPQKPLVSRLIYPMPEKNLAGLGIHCTLDLSGRAKFGPDTLYVDSPTDLSIRDDDGVLLEKFHRAIATYMPNVRKDQLQADYTGMRPKLAGPGQPFRDFVIEIPDDVPGFVNLVGIESPGLTSSQAIAEHVTFMLGLENK
eukprot:jgi/Hompol1/4410/HPOL_003655-RA